MTSMDDIRDFLASKRLFVIGVSRNPRDISRMLYRDLTARGYDLVPVNPAVAEIEGARCFASVAAADRPAEAALLFTKPEVTERVAYECAEAGVRLIWMYRAGGAGAVSPAAVAFCLSRGIRVIAGECPFMFLPNAGFPHGMHAFFRKLVGTYPQSAAAARLR